MSLKAVIFDFGGVLVRTRSQHLRRAWEERLGLAPGESSEIVFGGESGTAAQLGRITASQHWAFVARRLGMAPAELAAFQRDFFAEDVLDGTLLDYVDQLRVAGYHLGLLSNMWDTARELFGQTYSLLVHFDSVTISGEEGFMKPDARIFRVALHRAGVRPDEAVLVDDFAVNVEGARQAGMRAVYFRTPQQALLELASMTGVTPALAAGE